MLEGGLIPSVTATLATIYDRWTKRCVCGHLGSAHSDTFASTACRARGCGCHELCYPGDDERITSEIRASLSHLGAAELRKIAVVAYQTGRPRQAARFERVASERV